MSTTWNNRCLALGIALWFALVFGAFPATDPSLVMGGSFGDDKPPALVVAYSGVFAAVLLPLVARRVRLERMLTGLMVGACCLQYLGTALVVGVAVNPLVAVYVGGFLYGSGNICAIFAWGALLVRCKEDVRESVFIAAITMAGIILLLGGFLFSDHSLASILLFPIASLACFWKACSDVRELGVDGENGAAGERGGEGAEKPVAREMIPELLKLALVFGLVGFIWQLYATDTRVGTFEKGILFALGFILAAVALHLFVQYSSGVGVGSFVRWTFPIIAVGLLCASLDAKWLASAACVLFAGAHAALEAMMRIRAIGLARRYSAEKSAFVLGCGFAAISVGATAGETLFQVMLPLASNAGQTLTVVIFAVLVVVGAVIPESARTEAAPKIPPADGSRPVSDSERRACALARGYALSARELDVLVLMLDGRSGPVIRETLGLSKSTVDTHVRHIYQKVGVASKQELIDLSRAQ